MLNTSDILILIVIVDLEGIMELRKWNYGGHGCSKIKLNVARVSTLD